MSDVGFELIDFKTDFLGDIDINYLDKDDNLLFISNNSELFQFDLNINDVNDQPVEINKRKYSESFNTDNFQCNDDANVYKPLINTNIKLFPIQFVNAINSANAKRMKDFLKTYFSINCQLYIRLPFKDIEEVGFESFLNSFNNVITLFPDLICMLKGAKMIKGNGQSLIICKCRSSTTVSKETLDLFSKLDSRKKIPELLQSYNPNKDTTLRRDKTLNAIKELSNDSKYVRIYLKMRLRFYIDQSTNRITKFEEMSTLSSCELLHDDFIK